MSAFTFILLDWYQKNGRVLPWRGQVDPYAVWVSEVMLQQTRVETVIPYYHRWMKRFPTIEALAQSSEQEVLAVWEGLGYYSRARNFRKAAQIILAEHDGKLPCDLKTLRGLPGVGHYTAGALAALVCGLDEPALDGNVRRVLSRVFDITQPADSPAGNKVIWKLAVENLPSGRAADFNQALMDLGSAICTPRQPLCGQCPLKNICKAKNMGTQAERPLLKPKPARPHIVVAAAVISREGRLLLARRPSKGLLGGMWEFPGGKQEEGEDLASCLRREIVEELGTRITVGESIGIFRHAYTHFSVTLHAFACTLDGVEPQPLQASELNWVSPDDLPQYPMGKLDRQISQKMTAVE